MQLTAALAALAALTGLLTAAATTSAMVLTASDVPGTVEITPANEREPSSWLLSHDAMMHWLATTDAELTFIGDPPNPLMPRAAQNTMVTYCSSRTQNVCGGACTVYNGGAACLNAPDTNCLGATNNVGFCGGTGCGGICNQLSSCGTRLDNGFCFTPGTKSIIVPPS